MKKLEAPKRLEIGSPACHLYRSITFGDQRFVTTRKEGNVTMKRLLLAVVVLVAGACSSFTAPAARNEVTCKSGYLIASGDKCVPA